MGEITRNEVNTLLGDLIHHVGRGQPAPYVHPTTQEAIMRLALRAIDSEADARLGKAVRSMFMDDDGSPYSLDVMVSDHEAVAWLRMVLREEASDA